MTTQTLSLGSKPEIGITNVGGDLIVEGWERADLEARSDDAPRIEQDGDEVTLSCRSDLKISLPRNANLTISYVGGDLKAENLDGNVELSFVGGDVALQNITGEVSLEGVIGGETKTENVRKITMGMQGGHVGANVSAKVQRKVDEAMRRADRKIREAEQKLRQAHSDHLQSRMQDIEQLRMHHTGQPIPPRDPSSRPFNFGLNTSEAEEASQPVSDEERMAILKMLQEKKITSEEADKLLAALEGGE
ncbi:MAG: hypothetical protein WCA79_12575 [Anaerolineales bacterium]